MSHLAHTVDWVQRVVKKLYRLRTQTLKGSVLNKQAGLQYTPHRTMTAFSIKVTKSLRRHRSRLK